MTVGYRTLRSTQETGICVIYDSAKRKRRSKVRMPLDTLGYSLALHVAPTNVDNELAMKHLAANIHNATGDSVRLALRRSALH